jgi:CrcB protein
VLAGPWKADPVTFLLVCVAGAIGTLARWGLDRGLSADLPWGILAANLVGAAALGLVLGRVDRGAPAWVRPVVGTGLLGGFTTMSAFAVQTDQLADDRPGWAVAYLLVTVLAGPALARGGRSWAR